MGRKALVITCTEILGDWQKRIYLDLAFLLRRTHDFSLVQEAETIEEVYEPFLIQEGYLKRTSRGREATSKSFQHLGLAEHKKQGGLV